MRDLLQIPYVVLTSIKSVSQQQEQSKSEEAVKTWETGSFAFCRAF